ncbi:MAG: ABC transporter substrate-binding protein, partial [Vibrio sp.]
MTDLTTKGLKKTALAIVTSLACVAPASFAADVPAGVALAENQDLVRGIGSEVPTLDPTKTSDTSSSTAISDMFDGLVTEDLKGNVIPALATEWSESDDGLVYTFTLRDAKWSNGKPITAQDFVYSMRRLVDPATGSSYSWYLETAGIKNAAQITAGKAKPETLAVKAIDDKTLAITLENPRPYFLKTLT